MSKFKQFARHCQIVNVTMSLMVSSKLYSYSPWRNREGSPSTLSSLSWCVLRPSTVLPVGWESRPDEMLAAITPRWYDKCQGRYTLRAERNGTTERNELAATSGVACVQTFKCIDYKSCELPRYLRRKIKPSPRYYRNVCPYYRGVHAVTAVFPLSP